jgi:hypothetical protein
MWSNRCFFGHTPLADMELTIDIEIDCRRRMITLLIKTIVTPFSIYTNHKKGVLPVRENPIHSNIFVVGMQQR